MSSEATTGSSTRVQISPMLSVRNGSKAVEFYQKAFGARILFRIGEGDEPVVAQLAVGEAEFWLADESPEHSNFSPETLQGSSVRMVMVVEDPDAAFARALAAEPERSGRWLISTVGGSAASSTHLAIIGRLVSR